MKNESIVDIDYRTERCRVRVRLTLIVLLVIAAIAGSEWSREFLADRNNKPEQPKQQPQ